MKGRTVQRMRQRMGLSPGAFACILGVAPSTVYRWEANEDVKAEPVQEEILVAIAARKPDIKFGNRLLEVLAIRGRQIGRAHV